MVDPEKRRLANARFLAFRQHQPEMWNRDNVARFHSVIADLEEGYGIDLSSFRVTETEMKPLLVSVTRAPLSGRFPARRQYSKELFCDGRVMQERIQGIYLYLQGMEPRSPQPADQDGDPTRRVPTGGLNTVEGEMDYPTALLVQQSWWKRLIACTLTSKTCL